MKITKKTRFFSFVATIILVVFVGTSVPVHWAVNECVSRPGPVAFVAQADSEADHETGVVVVELKPRRNPTEVANRHHMTVLEDLEDNLYVFGLPDARTVEEAVAELEADHRDVQRAEPNYVLRAPEVDQRGALFVDQRGALFVDGLSPSDYFAQGALQVIGATEVPDEVDGGGATVAVIDTGIDTGHPAFSGDLAQGHDFLDNDDDPSEEGRGRIFGHGTMVAGVIALLAPEVTIMPLRAFDSDGTGKASKVGQAIRYAARNGADVITMSFGTTKKTAPIEKAIAFASRRGMTLIASAGNNDTSFPVQYPASDRNVLAIAATDNADIKAEFSNYGDHIAVCAPGVSIYSAYPGNRFAWGDGTSYAAAFVSGEAALVLSSRGGNVDQIIKTTAVNIDDLNPNFRRLLGFGRIDVLAAVSQ